jgi:uncharacterized membrane protein YtjA (UPF0391 family)
MGHSGAGNAHLARSRRWHGTWNAWGEPEAVPARDDDKEDAVLHYALIFLAVAIIAAVLGFTGIAGAAAGIAKILFLVFLVLFVGALLFGRRKSV